MSFMCGSWVIYVSFNAGYDSFKCMSHLSVGHKAYMCGLWVIYVSIIVCYESFIYHIDLSHSYTFMCGLWVIYVSIIVCYGSFIYHIDLSHSYTFMCGLWVIYVSSIADDTYMVMSYLCVIHYCVVWVIHKPYWSESFIRIYVWDMSHLCVIQCGIWFLYMYESFICGPQGIHVWVMSHFHVNNDVLRVIYISYWSVSFIHIHAWDMSLHINAAIRRQRSDKKKVR